MCTDKMAPFSLDLAEVLRLCYKHAYVHTPLGTSSVIMTLVGNDKVGSDVMYKAHINISIRKWG